MEDYSIKKCKNTKLVMLIAGLGLFLLGGAGVLLKGHDPIVMGGFMMLGCTLLGGAYIKNEEARASNEKKEASFKKKMKLHRRTLGLISIPKSPKFTPIREYTPDEIPVPCTGEFQDIAREAFVSGVLKSKKTGDGNFIYYTGKLI